MFGTKKYMAGKLVALLVGIILIVAVLIPTTVSVIGDVNWTGYEQAQTIAQLIPLMLAVGAIVVVVYAVIGGA